MKAEQTKSRFAMTYLNNMRKLREKHKFSQEDVAIFLGTSQTMYSRYERGENELPVHHLIPLCLLYHVSADQFLNVGKKRELSKDMIQMIESVKPGKQEFELEEYSSLSEESRIALQEFAEFLKKREKRMLQVNRINKIDAENENENIGLKLKIIDDTADTAAVVKTFRDAFAAGDVLSVLPDDVKAKLTAGNTAVNEMVTAQFVGDTTLVTGSIQVNIKFETLYSPAGDKVDVLIYKGGWTVLSGTVKDDGSIDMVITKDLISSLKNDAFVLGVVSK